MNTKYVYVVVFIVAIVVIAAVVFVVLCKQQFIGVEANVVSFLMAN